MPLSREVVLHISTLCRVGMTEQDLERAGEQLSQILEQFEVLKQIDTEGVAPTTQSVPLTSVFREDIARPSLTQEETLANAPQREGEFVRIRVVLEG